MFKDFMQHFDIDINVLKISEEPSSCEYFADII